MMDLNADQKDALVEICNVGMSKAAKQLSSLLSDNIEISIPAVNLFDVDSIYEDDFFNRKDELLSYVYQVLSDQLVGRVILIFHREHTTLLTQSVIGNAPKLTEKEVRACEQEAMIEIGNIIISSCMSAMVNMLKCRVKLSVPKYNEDHISRLIESQIDDIDGDANDVILIETRLDAAGKDISGKLLLILTNESVDTLFTYLKKLLGL